MIKYINCEGKEEVFFTKEKYEAAKQLIPYMAYKSACGMLYISYYWQQKHGKSNENKEKEESKKQGGDIE